MKIIRDYQFVNTSDRGASVAVGNFDGVHLGHQHVIEIARAWGKKNKSPLGVLTFEPHPRSYFSPESPSFRLMNSDAKSTRLNKLNVEKLFMEIDDTINIELKKIRDLQASFDKSMKILESHIAESITNKEKLDSIKRDLKEANGKFLEAERCGL